MRLHFIIDFDYKMSTMILECYFKYSMCELICDVISCCVWNCDTGKINVYDKVIEKHSQKERIWKSQKFLHLKDGLGLGMEFTACYMASW